MTIVTTLCPGGKERMRRLMSVATGRLDLRPLVMHRFSLDRIEEAYDAGGRGYCRLAPRPWALAGLPSWFAVAILSCRRRGGLESNLQRGTCLQAMGSAGDADVHRLTVGGGHPHH